MKTSIPEPIKQILETASLEKLTSLFAAVGLAEAHDTSLGTAAKIVFLRNYTIEVIEPFLKFRLYKEAIKPQIAFGSYDGVFQDLLNLADPHNLSSADIVVLSLILEQLDPSYESLDWDFTKTWKTLENLFQTAAKKTKAIIAVNNFFPPLYPRTGIAAGSLSVDHQAGVCALNTLIRDFVSAHSQQFFLLDWDRYLRVLGEEKSMDYRYWYLSKAPFKKHFLDLYASEIARIARILKGNIKKCLVLDCDNTLWGGVIGEDGLHGITLDRSDWPGKAYYDFQKGVLTLYERGILIALCSKNNPDDVYEVLDKHPHCLIKRTHIAAARINWDAKHKNLSSIAAELNLGLDSFVMLDDDPRELELIGQNMPEVALLPVPKQLYDYPLLLFRTGLFDALSVSQEDKNRTAMYRDQHNRELEKDRFEDLQQYLLSLKIVADIHVALPHEIPRIAQLTQKTNQFNLTTRRYSEPQIAELVSSSSASVFTLSVSDKFGDMGLTGVFIATFDGASATIDTLLLSCRILGKGLEAEFVRYCIAYLGNQRHIDLWNASYIQTLKNQQVENFWERVGFSRIGETNRETKYVLRHQELEQTPSKIIQFVGTVPWKTESRQ